MKTASIYDPQTAHEIGVSVNGAKAWKVYGNSGPLEATIVDAKILSCAYNKNTSVPKFHDLTCFARVGDRGNL